MKLEFPGTITTSLKYSDNRQKFVRCCAGVIIVQITQKRDELGDNGRNRYRLFNFQGRHSGG